MDRSPELELHLKHEPADIVRVAYWLFFKRIKFTGLLALVVLLLAFLEFEMGIAVFYLPLTVPVVLVLGLICIYVIAKRQFQRGQLVSDLTYRLSPMGMYTSTATSGPIAWSNMIRALETKRYFLIFNSSNQMYVIPKRYLATDDQIPALRTLLTVVLPGKAKMRKPG
jgi:hypothetical protein